MTRINARDINAQPFLRVRSLVEHSASWNFGRADQIIPGAAFRHLNNNK